MKYLKIGPVFVADNPPILSFLMSWIANQSQPVNVVELGPGEGTMAKALMESFPSIISSYSGIDTDEKIQGPYDRISSPAEIGETAHLLIASEVLEHMSAAEFFEVLMPALVPKLRQDATAIIGIPNALSPSSIFQDFSHVQGYPWYDLYALLRLFFRNVAIFRTRYVWSPERLLTLPTRMLLCRALELDWCEGLIAIASDIEPS